MRYIAMVFGVILILMSLLVLIAGEFIFAAIGIAIGLAFFFGGKNSKMGTVYGDSSKKKSDRPTERVFVAWSNKYEGLKSIVEDMKDDAEKYEGMNNKEIAEQLDGDEDEIVWEYPIQRGSDVYFKREPDNKYNDEAIEIYSKRHGKLGYVPDKNLVDINKIINNPPEDLVVEWTMYGGNAKAIDEDGKVYTKKLDRNIVLEIFY